LGDDHPAVSGDIPIEDLGTGPFGRQNPGQRGLAGLTRAGQENHFSAQIGPNKGGERAFHSTIFHSNGK
jgi:hypothetical protein